MFQTNKSSSGFSLVEVTIVIGLASFSLLAVMGTLTVGLTTNQEAMRQTAYTHILQQVASDLAMLPFEEIGIQNDAFFDAEGRIVDSLDQGIFHVTREMAVNARLYPGASGPENLSEHLKWVDISIRRKGESEEAAFRTTISAVNSGR